MSQCQHAVKLKDPFRMHAGYVTFLRNRMANALRQGKDWKLCQREGIEMLDGKPCCRQHKAYALLDGGGHGNQ